MSYQISKTDGTILATVADGQIDSLSTDLSLIGKNYSGFGAALNENLVYLLENFANTASPTHPITGQIWFDTSETKLKVYSGTEFIPVSSATIATTQPATLGVGDLWFNSVDKQLFFYDGTGTILLAPQYSVSQGKSGLEVNSILDTLNQTRVVSYLYNNGILLGIFSKDSFTPKNAIEGFAGAITPGFNAGSLAGLEFNVTATNSLKLGGIESGRYLRSDTSNAINGQLRITQDLGLVVGSAGQGNFIVNNGDLLVANAASGKRLILNVRNGVNQENAMVISSALRQIDLYSAYSNSLVNLGGSLTVNGNLTVNGTTTTINTTNLNVEDKNITLGLQTGVTPTDTLASGGGITLQGSTAHAIVWSATNRPAGTDSAAATAGGYHDALPALYSTAWTSTDHINLKSGKYFAIDGQMVISGNSLGAGITSIPGVTAFGTQNVVNIGPGIPPTSQMRIETNSGSSKPRISTLSAGLNLELAPYTGSNVALINSPKITGLADPTSAQDAATKEYVDNEIQTRNLAFSIDLSDSKPNSYIITNILNNIAPPAEYRNGTLARILCSFIINSTGTININPLISTSSSTFNTPTGTAPALTNISIGAAIVPAASTSTSRIIKTFQIVAGVWAHVTDQVLPG